MTAVFDRARGSLQSCARRFFAHTHHSIALEELLRFSDPLCSTCDALDSALSEASPSDSSNSSSKSAAALDEECRSCCTPDDVEGDGDDVFSSSSAAAASDSSLPKATSAILEVCRSRLRAHRPKLAELGRAGLVGREDGALAIEDLSRLAERIEAVRTAA